VIAAVGWALSAALLVWALRMHRRLELVARAEHELRGPAAALTFAVSALRREAGGLRRALRFESELERLRTGLADLSAARTGRRAAAEPRTVPLEQVLRRAAAGWTPPADQAGRPIDVRWDAGHAWVRADRGRLAQAFGNVLANAVEHGSGPIEITAVRKGPRAVRVEVTNATAPRLAGRPRRAGQGRGRGLGIASRAMRDAGGRLRVQQSRDATTATLDLPLSEDGK
jgi:signal transduction histidine kinase